MVCKSIGNPHTLRIIFYCVHVALLQTFTSIKAGLVEHDAYYNSCVGIEHIF